MVFSHGPLFHALTSPGILSNSFFFLSDSLTALRSPCPWRKGVAWGPPGFGAQGLGPLGTRGWEGPRLLSSEGGGLCSHKCAQELELEELSPVSG